MKRLLIAAGLLVGCLLVLSFYSSGHKWPTTLPPIEVYFSPKGGCTEAIVEEIGRAKQEILVQAYSFTSPAIATALAEAHGRGVEVRVILDDSQKKDANSQAPALRDSGLEVWIDGKHSIAHNKIVILDGQVVVTGSFNFTRQAENSNAENLLVIRDPQIAATYTDNWKLHRSHATPYAGPEEPEPPRKSKTSTPRGKVRT
jgi:phosphatidylserine/phosphatidylglycerophosphate/cardiolipin synthase-like enzyme